MKDKQKNSLAIIICMYNEEKSADECIERVIKEIKKVTIPTKILIINDGSSDNTAKILNQKLKKYKNNIIIYTHQKNKGFGAANSTGIQKALEHNFTWGLHMDAGLTNDPKYIHDFIKEMSDKVDCIKASRYIKKSKVIGVPKYRRLISIVGNTFASTLFSVGIRDCTNGFRMIRLKHLKGIQFKENNYAMILEELYYLKKKHAIFQEIPYILTMKKDTVSHFYYRPKLFYDYFKYALKSLFLSIPHF